MKVVILAGGLGTRLSEETSLKPKPLVEIGGLPILWHIMQIFAHHGLTDFVVCGGYKNEMIKSYFANYFRLTSDVRIDLSNGHVEYLSPPKVSWTVTIVDTGSETMTGGRIKRIARYLDDEPFCLTYGDGVSDVDIGKLVDYHKSHDRAATVTSVPSPGRFGILDLDSDGGVTRFHEKPDNEMGWINGGFFVLDPGVIDYIDGDSTVWEKEPLETLARDNQLAAFRHTGFWRPMDTLRDKNELNDMWESGNAPWKKWS